MFLRDRVRIARVDFEVWLEDLVQRWEKYRCNHDWSPALLKGSPAKHCRKCESTINISPEEFYAVFSEHQYVSMSYTVRKIDV